MMEVSWHRILAFEFIDITSFILGQCFLKIFSRHVAVSFSVPCFKTGPSLSHFLNDQNYHRQVLDTFWVGGI